MSENDLTPRVLAGLALAADPARFMSFRLMPDGDCVVVDQDGRKFILTQAELARVEAETTARRLHARGRALVEDLKNGVIAEPEKRKPKKTEPQKTEKKGSGPTHTTSTKTASKSSIKAKKGPGPGTKKAAKKQ